MSQEHAQLNIKFRVEEKAEFKKWCRRNPRMTMSDFVRASWKYFQKHPSKLMQLVHIFEETPTINEREAAETMLHLLDEAMEIRKMLKKVQDATLDYMDEKLEEKIDEARESME